jgi:hypothetical protein
MIRWQVENLRKLEGALRKPLQNVRALVRTKIGSLEDPEDAA